MISKDEAMKVANANLVRIVDNVITAIDRRILGTFIPNGLIEVDLDRHAAAVVVAVMDAYIKNGWRTQCEEGTLYLS